MRFLMQSLSCSLLMTCCGLSAAFADDLSSVEQKAATCFACHGDKGKGSDPHLPSLAAQQSVYIVNQLNAFKSGERKNPAMQSKASNLTTEDINNYGAYFAVQQAAKAGGDSGLAQQGKVKAAMCLGCHGGAGEGNGQYPRLAGQHPDYLAQQLSQFKNGSRKNTTMQAIAANLSEDDIKVLAAFFGSL
ncbi:MAG: c-type cytochrome [Methyloglobulus sp.]|nr:cytochrome c4 [Methyloglobulus sp.]